MNVELAMVLGLLAAAVAMFAANRPRMDAVALLMLALLPLTGVVTVNEALAGFSDPSVVMIALLFVVGEGLVRTGVAQHLGDWLAARAGKNEARLLMLLMAVTGALGSVMSSTGVVAIFIPVTLRIAAGTGIAPSRLMMPLSVAALISGMITLVGTAPNLVVNGELIREIGTGFGFLSFTPFGIVILAAGIAYMLFARRWLAQDLRNPATAAHRPTLQDWIRKYGLAGREYRLRVTRGSPLIGRTVGDLSLRKSSGASIVAIERPRRFHDEVIAVSARVELEEGDILLVDLFAPKDTIEALQSRFGLEPLPLSGGYFTDRSHEIGMAEVLVAENTQLIGKTLVESRFRSLFGLTVIGLRRGQGAIAGSLLDERIAMGDVLLVIGPWKEIRQIRSSASNLLVLNLPAEFEGVLPAPGRARLAVGCLILMVVLMVTGIVPNVQAALITCLLLGAFRCVDFDSAYRSIHWKSLILIVGMLPFSIALQRTGGVDMAASALMSVTATAGTTVILGVLFLVTAALGLFISNTATAVLMAPVALAMARDLRASPLPFAVIVALAASAAFMTPVSSPVNTLVVGPGNYRFGDFIKVGVPFTFIVMAIAIVLVPLLLPLYK
jgi:di/tricarboxylate transporter